jgi:hypothetical protein
MGIKWEFNGNIYICIYIYVYINGICMGYEWESNGNSMGERERYIYGM